MGTGCQRLMERNGGRITIIALGSRGDVQPFVALGLGLEKGGYRVRVAAAEDYRWLVEDYGLQFAPLVGRIRDLMDPELVYTMLEGASNPLLFGKRMLAALRPVVRRLVDDCYSAARDADALVVSTLGVYAAYDIACELHIPLYPAHMHVYGSTRAYRSVFFPPLPRWSPLRGTYNRASHWLVEAGFWQLLASGLREGVAQTLGRKISRLELLKRASFSGNPTLLAYSPRTAPRPKDWGRQMHVTGYWPLEQPCAWEPQSDLVRFLESGPPPVYVSFGSVLAGRNPDDVTRLLVRALGRAGQRGIIYSAWDDLGNIDLPPTVLRIGSVPHSWLFPRLAAVVHHGGAGTTAAVLRAGVPSVVVPFYGDQHFWAARLFKLGVAAGPLPRAKLSEDRLAAAIKQAVTGEAMRARVTQISKALQRENGVRNAVEILSTAMQETPAY